MYNRSITLLATAFVYIHTNITTCALTHSPNLNKSLIFVVYLISCKTL
jgi:hypothetical protein